MKRKSILGSVALVLVGVLGIAYVGFSVARNNWNPAKWVKSETEVNQTTPPKGEEKVQGGAVVTESESKGIRLMSTRIAPEDYEKFGIDRSVKNVFNLSVNYEPATTTATYQETIYSIAFKNPESAWAAGKNVSDYATITQSGYSKDATLQILQSFSEQIIVTATNRHNQELSATTTVDYVGTHDFFFESNTLATLRDEITFQYNGLIDGTVAPDIETSLTIRYKIYLPTFVSEMQKQGYTVKSEFEVNYPVDPEDPTTVADSMKGVFWKACDTPDQTNYWLAVSNCYTNYGKIAPADVEGTEIMNIDIIMHRVYNGVVYEDVIYNNEAIDVGNCSELEVAPTGIKTNNSSVTAG